MRCAGGASGLTAALFPVPPLPPPLLLRLVPAAVAGSCVSAVLRRYCSRASQTGACCCCCSCFKPVVEGWLLEPQKVVAQLCSCESHRGCWLARLVIDCMAGR